LFTEEQWRTVSNWIPYRWFEDMEKMAIESSFDGYERAFTLCARNQTVRKTQTCTGKKCTVTLPTCAPYETNLGYYHTHPHGKDDFSIGDTDGTLSLGARIQCVGTIVDAEYPQIKLLIPEFRVKCLSWNLEHPRYKHHKDKIREVSNKAHDLEINIAKEFYERGKKAPHETWTEYYEQKNKFRERMRHAEEEGVIVRPWGTQGIDESFGIVSRKLIEHSREIV